MTAVLFLLRAIVLVLLWAFVIAAVVAVRHDIFGTRRTAPSPAPPPVRRAPKPEKSRTKPAASAHARKLVIVDGARTGHTIPLSGTPITIGRADDATLVLSDDYVSSRHARLLPRGDAWVLEDTGSTNGTYLDRKRINAPTPVPLGVPIRIGKTVLELRP
ncbi:MAG TPA: FHA domain-containing protein [Mycobacteriales bacterium]|nr:FHA domain-containing protein [Mycobacteriales bacterium]